MPASIQTSELTFSECSWGRYRYDFLGQLEALLFPEERKLMAWMAEHLYSGEGEIIDAGAFLGGSAACFAYGLERNKAVPRKESRIHSYDLFRKGNWLPAPIKFLEDRGIGQSTIDIYHGQISKFEHMMVVYPGDITKRTWSRDNIEFLMLDCCKTKSLNNYLMRMFMPSLIPGKSFLIHQDFAVHSTMYWLHSTMYLLRDYFKFEAVVRYGGTTIFRCLKQITPEIIDDVIARQDQDVAAMFSDAMEYSRALGNEKIARAIEFSYQRRLALAV